MFDRLSDGFSSALRRLSGQANISEANIKEALDDVRTALLEADVQYDLVNEFIGRVKKDAVGHEVTKAVKPGQEFIWICNQRLTELMSEVQDNLPEDGNFLQQECQFGQLKLARMALQARM